MKAEELDQEYRGIISHAFLGEDENISKEGFNLAVDGCVKFHLSKWMKDDIDLADHHEYWQGRLIDNDQAYEIATEIVTAIGYHKKKYNDLLIRAIAELTHARTFIRSREKMHSDGIKLYDELLDELNHTSNEG